MLPVETTLALFPSAVVVGKITLRPLTLAHAAALETLGVDTRGSVTESQALLCGWILSKDPEDVISMMCNGCRMDGFSEWIDENSVDAAVALKGVRMCFRQGTVGFVPGKDGDGKSKTVKFSVGSDLESGFGWPLEIAECFAHEYSCSLDEAMCTPLSRIFGMLACGRQREGGEAGGPDYYERIFQSRVKIAKVAKNVKIVKTAVEKGLDSNGGQ